MKYVELHIHLDGSVRVETLFYLAKKKNVLPPDINTSLAFSKFVSVNGKKSFNDLSDCLSIFNNIVELIKGDKHILERIAFEFCEDQYYNNMIYTEVRYNPHILQGELTCDEVIQSINRGIRMACMKYPIYVNTILCCLRNFPDLSEDIVLLADTYRDSGVVGIDLAGDETHYPNELHEKAFELAKKKGINITVHAGENGNYKNIISALDKLHAQRIGHGYAAIKNIRLMRRLKKENIHLECCATSSLQTCSVEDLEAIQIFREEKMNYSINSDDPSIFEIKYQDEIDLLKEKIFLDDEEVKRVMLNSIDAAFISKKEKDKIKSLI